MQFPVNFKVLVFCVLLVFSAGNLFCATITSEQRQFFESEIRPVLAENCYNCHSTKAKKLKGGLFLDHGSTILSGGDSGPALVAGDLDKSLLIEAVRYKDPDSAMPPKKSSLIKKSKL
jgi:hypothetical protein